VNKPYPEKVPAGALGKPPMGMVEKVTSHPKRWVGVCVGRAIEPRNSLFAEGEPVPTERSQHGSDEGPNRRGPRSSARARKVCCTGIGRLRTERTSRREEAANRAAVARAMETSANGGKA
jgi:hypothetical protein